MSSFSRSLISFLLVNSLNVIRVQSKCPYGYVAYKTEACFLLKHEQDVLYSAEEAEKICNRDNATLATVENLEQNDWLRNVFMHDKKIQYTLWIGLIKDERTGTWKWKDGNKSPYRNWNPTKPDSNSEHENCAHYDISYANESSYELGWNDDVCNEESYRIQGYICRAPFQFTSKVTPLCSSSSDRLFSITGWAIGGSIGVVAVLILFVVLGVFAFRKYGYYFKSNVPLTRLENVG